MELRTNGPFHNLQWYNYDVIVVREAGLVGVSFNFETTISFFLVRIDGVALRFLFRTRVNVAQNPAFL